MKHSIIKLSTIYTLSLFIVRSALCSEPPVSVEELSKILSYPAEKLSVRDVTEASNREASRKGRALFDSVHIYTGESANFAKVSIGIAKEGTLLTGEKKLYVNETILKMAETGGTNLLFKWLSFEDLGQGVSGLFMVGAGGSTEESIMTLYGKSDVTVSTSRGASALEVLPGAEKYNKLVQEGGIQEKMVELLTLVASKSAGRPVTVTAGAVLPTNSPAPVTIPKLTPDKPIKNEVLNLNQTTNSVEPSDSAPATDVQATSDAEPSSFLKSLLVSLVAILGAAAAFALLRTKKQG